MKRFLVSLFLACAFFCHSQTPKEKILSAITNYYSLDRESIYAHFDKAVFFYQRKDMVQRLRLQQKKQHAIFRDDECVCCFVRRQRKQVERAVVLFIQRNIFRRFRTQQSIPFRTLSYFVLYELDEQFQRK